MSVELELYTKEVKEELRSRIVSALYEIGGEAINAIKSFCRVKTARTRESFDYIVDDDGLRVVIGTNYENAIWEEFGTGIYALNGDGRKMPWSYQDAKGQWHRTRGKKPQRMLHRGFEKIKSNVTEYFKKTLGGL